MIEVKMSVKNKKWKARKRKNRDVLAPYLGESLIISGNIEFYTNTINKGITGPKRNMVLLTNVKVDGVNQLIDHLFLITGDKILQHPVNTNLTIKAEVYRYIETTGNNAQCNYRYAFRLP